MRSVQQSASVYVLKHTLRLILVLSLLLAIGATSAQEMTPEPTQPADQPTAIPTDAGITPTAAPTEAPPELPTDVPTEISTEVITTVEPTVEPTQVDTTPVPTEVVPTPIPQPDQFIEDFQDGETTGWLLTPNWGILTEDTNAFLSAAVPQENAILQAVNWPYFSLVFKIRVDQGGTGRVAFAASGYQFSLEIGADGSLNLFQDSVLVGQSAGVVVDPAVEFVPAWRTVQVLVPGYVVAAKVDEFAPVSATGLALDGASGLSFGTGGTSSAAVAYDDIVVTRLDAPPPPPTAEPITEPTVEAAASMVEVTAEATLEAEVTFEPAVEATPETTVEAAPVLTSDALQKLPVPLQEMLMLVSTGDSAAVNASAASHFVTLDEQGRLEVILWMRSEAEAALIASEVQSAGGIVRESFSVRLTVQVTVEQLLVLVNRPEIGLVELPSRAVSTANQNGFIAGPLDAPTGPTATAGMDVVGASAWHSAVTPVLGSGIDIVVIDTGFNAPVTTEHACLGNPAVVFGGPTLPTDTNHGMRVVEVLCDVAPSARVYMYKATNATTLASAINTANTNPIKIILITMDLGASVSPGDGTGGGALYGIDGVYTAITNARNAGRAVVVSAGNNRGRYVTLNWNGTNSSVPMQVFAGDTIHVSWNDWSNTLNGATLENFGLSLTGDLNQSIRPGGAARVGPPRQTYTVPAGTCVSGCNVNLVVNGFVGDAGNVVVQIQVAGQGTINVVGVTGSPVLPSAGTIGRPADSQDAIAVGAVCADYLGRFPLDTNSANGPVFGSGGAAPSVTGPFLRDQIKPDLVGPSHVSVSGLAANPFDCFDGSGFNGTSAAAAHVAGMVALMISNTNPGMVLFDGVSGLTIDAIQDYLQTRAIDLPFFDFSTAPQGLESTSILSDSFDMTYGAGLATLGSSTFNLANSVNPLAAADTLPPTCDASPIYVGQAAPSLPQSGTLTNPYVSLQYALRQATSSDCVVAMPGEYTAPIYVPQGVNAPVLLSYESATSFASSASNFWVVNNYNLQAGIAIKNNDIVLDGFAVNPGDVYKVIPGSKDAIPLLVSDSSGTIIRNNVFTGFKSALLVSDGSGVQITGNSFLNFAIPSTSTPFGPQPISDTAVLSIRGTAAPAQANVVSNNLFQGTTIVNFPIQTSGWVSALIGIRTTAVDVVRNRFNANTSATLVGVNQWVAPGEVTKITSEIRVIGNLMTSNTINGPLLHLYQAPNLRFVNNTVLNNSMSGGTDFDSFFLYGFPGQSSLPQLSDRKVEIHNNLFYGNGGVFRGLIYQQLAGGGFIACTSINGGIPIRNNWFVPLELSTTLAGVCQNTVQNTYIANSVVDVITPATEASVFFTTLADAANPYRLRPLTVPVPGFVGGVNTGDNQALIDIYGNPGYLNQLDLRFGPRVRAGANANQSPAPTVIDIGAYELEVPSAPTAISPSPVNITEDSTAAISFTLSASGGYVQSFALGTALPENYDTNLANACAGQPVRFTPPNIVTYCPPANFNTQSPTNSPITIPFTVSDPIFYPGLVSSGTITLNIQAVDDGPPSATNYRLLTDYVTPITQQLFPTYQLNNFVISGSANGLDYPFTFSYQGQDNSVGGQNANLLQACPACATTDTVLQNAFTTSNTNGGKLILNPVAGQQGFYRFRYQVSDRDNETAIGIITLVVLPSLAKEGRHDDASFVFALSGNGWTPSYNASSYNTTLSSSIVGGGVNAATIEFPFTGAAVRLNLIGSAAGTALTNNLGIRFKLDLGAGASPILTYAQAQSTLSGLGFSLVCTNSLNGQQPDAGSNVTNYSATSAAYSLLCTGFPPDQAHSISLINNLNGAALTLDSADVGSGQMLVGNTYQENSLNLTYTGVWTDFAGVGPIGGAFRFSNDPSARVRFNVDSTVGRVIIYRTTASIYGSTQIYVDGVLTTTMNNASAAFLWAQPYVLTLTPGNHTVELRNVGSTYTSVDAISVLPPAQSMGVGLYQETFFDLAYTGNWVDFTGAGLNGGSFRFTNDPNGRVRFTINSSVGRLIFYRTMFSIYGSTQIYVDDVLTATMNNNSPTLLFNQPYVLNVTPGNHSIELRNMGSTFASVDAIELLPPPTPLGLGTYQETNANLVYSGVWTDYSGVGPNGGSFRFSNDPTARVRFSVTNAVSRVVFYRTLFSIYGSTQIYVDDVLTATMNNNSPTLSFNQPFVLNLTPGDHIIELRNVGSTYTSVDAIALLGAPVALGVGSIQENHPDLTYTGNWVPYTGVEPKGGSFRFTNDPNAQMQFRVDNTVGRIVFYRTMFSIYGSADIRVNGTSIGSLPNNSAALLWGQPFMITLTPGNNLIEIRNTSSNYISVDQIDLLPPAQTLGLGYYQETEPNLTYSGQWFDLVTGGPQGGSLRYTNDPTARMRFTVNNTVSRVVFYRTTASMYGSTEIWVNGSLTQTMNNTTASYLWGQPYTLNLTPGTNVIELRNVGSNFGSVDAISLLGSSTTFGLGSYQENHPDLIYTGTWVDFAGSGPSGGSFRYTNDPSGRVRFNVDNTVGRIVFYRTTASIYGSMEVWVNGVQQTPNMLNTTTSYLWAQPFTVILTPGNNQVELRNVGSSFGSLDAFDLLPPANTLSVGTVQETNANLTYFGVWTDFSGVGPLDGLFRYSNDPSARVRFTVDNTVGRVVIYRTMLSIYGQTQVFVNNTLLTTINSNSPALLWGQPVMFSLTPGNNTIELRNVGSTYTSVDRIDLLPPAGVLGTGTIEENAPDLTYTGNWLDFSGVGPRNGAFRYTNDPTARVSFTVNSSVERLIFYRTMLSIYGSADIYVNGAFRTTLPSTYPALLWGQPFMLTLTPGTNTIELRNTSANYMSVDSIALLGAAPTLTAGLYEESDPGFTYTGAWISAQTPGPSGNATFYTFTQGATVTFQFNGDGLVFYRTLAPGAGTFSVSIDGGSPVVFSDNSAVLGWQQPGEIGGLTNGPHTAVVTITSPSTNFIYFDAVRVVNSTLPITPGDYQNTYPGLVYTVGWSVDVPSGLSGGRSHVTTQNGQQMSFSFTGTGFSIFTTNTPNSANMEVCYTLQGGSPVCVVRSTTANPTQNAVGYSTYGLRQGTYNVTVRHQGTAGQPLYVDSLVVIGTLSTVLQPGTYEDSAAGIVYSPADQWITYTGTSYLGGTLRGTTQSGALAQVRFTGNSMILYQVVSPGTSGNTSLCVTLIDPQGNPLLRCAVFSQRSASTVVFASPIAFYGFGSGTHDVIIENRWQSGLFNIDRILIN